MTGWGELPMRSGSLSTLFSIFQVPGTIAPGSLEDVQMIAGGNEIIGVCEACSQMAQTHQNAFDAELLILFVPKDPRKGNSNSGGLRAV